MWVDVGERGLVCVGVGGFGGRVGRWMCVCVWAGGWLGRWVVGWGGVGVGVWFGGATPRHATTRHRAAQHGSAGSASEAFWVSFWRL